MTSFLLRSTIDFLNVYEFRRSLNSKIWCVYFWRAAFVCRTLCCWGLWRTARGIHCSLTLNTDERLWAFACRLWITTINGNLNPSLLQLGRSVRAVFVTNIKRRMIRPDLTCIDVIWWHNSSSVQNGRQRLHSFLDGRDWSIAMNVLMWAEPMKEPIRVIAGVAQRNENMHFSSCPALINSVRGTLISNRTQLMSGLRRIQVLTLVEWRTMHRFKRQRRVPWKFTD